MDYNNPIYTQPNDQVATSKPSYRKYVIMGIFAVIVFAIFWFYYSYSYIQVGVQGAKAQPINYKIYRDGDEVSSGTTTDKTFKKLVSRGDYEVQFIQDNNYGVAFLSAKGFLGTNKNEANLTSEKNRQFIGNKPLACGVMPFKELISYSCNGEVTDSYIHMIADSKTPPFTKQLVSPYVGKMEGVVNVSGSTYFIIKAPETIEEQAPHAAYLLNKSGELGRAYPLNELQEDQNYILQSYKDGFLAIETTYSKAFYYSNPDQKATEVDISFSESGDINRPYTADVLSDTILIGITEQTVQDEEEELSGDTPNAKSIIILTTETYKKEYTLDKTYSKISICGTDKLCGFLNKKVAVYDIGGGKAILDFVISDVDAMDIWNRQMIITREKQVLRIDPDKASGGVDFVAKDSTTCGIQPLKGSYFICLEDIRGNKNALEIINGQPNKVTEYVNELMKIRDVNIVSPYKNYIYISPNLGEYKYNESTNNFDYDSETKTRVNTEIREKINSFNADPKYKFINPLDF